MFLSGLLLFTRTGFIFSNTEIGTSVATTNVCLHMVLLFRILKNYFLFNNLIKKNLGGYVFFILRCYIGQL